MRKFLLFLFVVVVFLILPQESFAADANYNISPPQPIPPGSDIGVAINGKGFGSYLFSLGSTLQLQFTVNTGGCVKNSGNTTIYKEFRDCKVTDASTESWTVTIIRSGLTQGVYQLILDPNRLINASVTVGNPVQAPFESLNVKVYSSSNPAFFGPFSDASANDLTIEWNPAITGRQYEITTTLPQYPALPSVTCQSTTCSTRMIIAQRSTTGVQTATVKQSGETTRGSTVFEITSSTVEKPSPPPYSSFATPPPNCTEGLRDPKNPNSVTTKPDEIIKCTKVATGLGFALSTNPAEFAKTVFGILLSLAGGVAIVLIMLSGYGVMFSQGNPEKVQAAKEQLTAAIVGLLFIIFSLSILQIIGVDILHIPGLSR